MFLLTILELTLRKTSSFVSLTEKRFSEHQNSVAQNILLS